MILEEAKTRIIKYYAEHIAHNFIAGADRDIPMEEIIKRNEEVIMKLCYLLTGILHDTLLSMKTTAHLNERKSFDINDDTLRKIANEVREEMYGRLMQLADVAKSMSPEYTDRALKFHKKACGTNIKDAAKTQETQMNKEPSSWED